MPLWMILAPVFLPPLPAPDIEGPVAVLALVSGQDADLLDLAREIQARLEAQSSSVEVIVAAALAERLGTGPLDGQAEDLAGLQNLFDEAYLHSYSFENEQAIAKLRELLERLARLQPSPERWRLFVRSQIFLGIALAGLKRESDAMRAFATVLRTRPELELTRQEYSGKTIALWNKARQRLASLPTGTLEVQTERKGAQVLLDGVHFGTTPFSREIFQGRYDLRVEHPDEGSASRWVTVGAGKTQLRMDLLFEGAIRRFGPQPAIELPAGQRHLPEHWYPWLARRLGAPRLIAVRRDPSGAHAFHGALIHLATGAVEREAHFDLTGEELAAAAAELAAFLLSGQASARLRIPAVSPLAKAEEPEPLAALVPELPDSQVASSRPWYRRWWVYSLGAAALLGGGIGAHAASVHYQHQADASLVQSVRNDNQRLADAMLGTAIGAYCLAGAAVAIGLALDWTYRGDAEDGPTHTARIAPAAAGLGLQLGGRF
ncbi:MAG: PEGA domain-containing protein [Deltaproteobacteria bacterium]|nr:PEGA domain-containing protein [Deltaproteobacteria bacterium]